MAVSGRIRGWGAICAAALAVALGLPAAAAAFERPGAAAQLLAQEPTLPDGFAETVAFSGLDQPAAVRFAPDGRVFVAEKGGRVFVFSDLGDPTPALYADLSEDVHDYWDRGLLGLALDPEFTTGRPYVYVLYAYNKDPNSAQVPRWPDSCPDPPGGTEDGCTISGRLSRLGGGFEQVLIEDWCQQYPSHSIGSLAFGQDGALYVSGGDGASFDFTDWGQAGVPRNPCGDPPYPTGGALEPPSSEGGALRSQDIRTAADPTGLGGTILRVNPDSGAALPDNPNAGSPDPNARRIVAYGLRNPFRMTVRPGTNEIWTGDVGWRLWEEVNRVPNPTGEVRNFGWPCYEGMGRMEAYDVLDLQLCESLYQQGAGAHARPHFAYDHRARVVAGEACPFGASSISGVAFTPQVSSFPSRYDGALFFADFSRRCIWVMLRGAGGLPDPDNVETFVSDAEGPAELQFGPGGDLYYADILGGTIRRIRATTGNHAPVARATATPSSGPTPLTVAFDGSASSDPDGPLTYAWDLDGDGFDDGTAPTATRTYATPGNYTARLRVRDGGGLEDVYSLPIAAGTPPSPTMSVNAPAGGWNVDDTISFSGSATSGAPPVALSWRVNLRHCDRGTGTCHTHPLQSLTGTSGSFAAPDHEYPAYLEIELTARDAHGLTATVKRRLDPKTVRLSIASRPPGISVALGGETAAAPFTREVIQGSTNTVGVESPQPLGGAPYVFHAWSDGSPRSHTRVVSADTTLKATFERDPRRRLAGADHVGPDYAPSVAGPGVAEVYRTTADGSGTATELRLFLQNSAASALVMGLYADAGGQPGALLGSGRTELPTRDGWNPVAVNIPGIEAGRNYWIGLLNPSDSTGNLRWRDRANGPGAPSPELQSDLGGDLDTLPGTWVTAQAYDGGPVSGYVFGTPPPGLVVEPGSLSFTAQAGAASPPAKSIAVSNAAGGDLAFSASDDAGWLTVSPASGRAPDDATVAVDTAGLPPGTYTGTVRIETPGMPARQVPVTLTLAPPPVAGPDPPQPSPPLAGPVGAWGFDESRGATARDASGSGNPGRLSGPVRTRGRFGGGLAFDGVDDWVTVADSASLDLATGMTLEAWVRPAALGSRWRTVLVKERPGHLAYALYAGTGTRPSGHVFTTRDRGLRGPAALPRRRWSHLAVTWDGLIMVAYVDGREVARHALVGPATTSSRPLRIGGNAIWPEWFKGVIDEVRVYDRALGAAEVAADRRTAVNPGARFSPPKRSKRRATPHRTEKRVHRGTRWLNGGAAARAG